MKKTLPTLRSILAISALSSIAILSSCNKDHDHGPGGHTHGPDTHTHGDEKPKGDAKTANKKHDHGDHDHSQCGVKVGKNGGRLITKLTPNAEFLITDAGKITLQFFNDKNEVVDGGIDSVTVLLDSEPVELFKKDKGYTSSVVSDKLPASVIVSFKKDGKKLAPEKFEASTKDCADCSNKSYSCTCHNHDHGDHGHDHGDHGDVHGEGCDHDH